MAPSGRLQDLRRIDTRQRLARAALELAQEHGADQIKPEDIAQRAGVSRRTLFNYVPSASAALSIPVEDFLAVMRQKFLDRLADANPYQAAADAMSAIDPALIASMASVCAVAITDTAERYRFALWSSYEPDLREAIAQHLDPGVDRLYVYTVVAAIIGAARVAVTIWTSENPTGQHPERFTELYIRALNYLGGASAVPTGTSQDTKLATETPANPERHDADGHADVDKGLEAEPDRDA